jgi:hypothetical protein
MLARAEAWARRAAFPVFVFVMPWRCSLVPPQELGEGAPSAVTPKEEAPGARVATPPARSVPTARFRLPDEVVVKAVGVGQPALLRCWARAQKTDPGPSSTKVRLHIDIDATGRVTAVDSDSDSPALSRCLAVVARQLPFPAPGRPAAIDVPLIFH